MPIPIIDGFEVNSPNPIDTVRTRVNTIADRDAIKQTVRYDGLETYVRATKTKYQLQGGIENSNWVPLKTSAIPDFAFNSLDELRATDVSQIGTSSVDVWLYQTNQLFEWDVFSTAADNNTTIIKPTMLTNEQAGRFVFKTELAQKVHNHTMDDVAGLSAKFDEKSDKTHTHELNANQFANGVQVVNGKAELGGAITKPTLIKNTSSSKLLFGTGLKGSINQERVFPTNDGGYLVLSNSTTYNDKGIPKYFKINASGQVDTNFISYPTTGSSIKKLVIAPNGKIFMIGEMTLDGVVIKNICRLNYDGLIDLTFNQTQTIGYATSDCNPIVLDDNSVVMPMIISSLMTLVKFDINGARVNSFTTNIGVGFNSTSGTVKSSAMLNDGSMLWGGMFKSFNGNTQYHQLVKIKPDGNIDNSFNTGNTGVVGSHATYTSVNFIKQLSDGKIYISGDYITTYNGVAVNKSLFRLNSDGTLDTTFVLTQPFTGVVNNIIELENGVLLIIGEITYNSQRVIYALNPDLTRNTTFNCSISTDGWILDSFYREGVVTISGTFTSCNGVVVNKIANINPVTGAILYAFGDFVIGESPLSYEKDFGDRMTPRSIIDKGNTEKLINKITENIKKDVSTVKTEVKTHTHPLDSTQYANGVKVVSGQLELGGDVNKEIQFSLKPAFNTVNGFTGMCTDMAITTDGRIAFIGNFLTYKGRSFKYITMLMPNGDIDESFSVGTGFNTPPTSIIYLEAEGSLVVTGNFTSYNGVACSKVVKLFDGYLDGGFAPSINGKVTKVVKDINDKLLIIGNFTTSANGNYISRLENDGTLDLTFNSGGIGFDIAPKGILALNDGKYLAWGQFTSYNGTAAKGLLRLTETGELDTTFSSICDTFLINDVTVDSTGSYLLVVGDFETYAGSVAIGLVQLSLDGDFICTTNGAFNTGAKINSIVNLNDGSFVVVGSFYEFTISDGSIIDFNGIAKFYETQTICDDSFFRFQFGRKLTKVIQSQLNGKLHIIGDSSFTNVYGLGSDYAISIKEDGRPDIASLIFDYPIGYNNGDENNIEELLTDFSLVHKKYVSDNFTPKAPFSNNNTQYCIRNNKWSEVAFQSLSNGITQGKKRARFGGDLNRLTKINGNGLVSFFGNGFYSEEGTPITVNSILEVSDGIIVSVSGTSPQYDVFSIGTLIKIDLDGELDTSFAQKTDCSPSKMIRQINGNVLLFFNDLYNGNLKGETLKRIICIDTNGNILASMQSNVGTGFDGAVTNAKELQDGRIVVCGYISKYNNISIPYGICVLNSDLTLDTSFSLNLGIGANFGIEDVEVANKGTINETIVVIGAFTTFKNVTVNGICKLNTFGVIDATFNAGIGFGGTPSSNRPFKIKYDSENDKFIIVGSFSTYNAIARKGIVRILTNGNIDTTFTSPFTTTYAYFKAIEIIDGVIYCIGFNFKPTAIDSNGNYKSNFVLDAPTGGGYSGITKMSNGKLLIYGAGGTSNLHMNGYNWGGIVYIKTTGEIDTVKSKLVFGGSPIEYETDLSVMYNNRSIPDVGYVKNLASTKAEKTDINTIIGRGSGSIDGTLTLIGKEYSTIYVVDACYTDINKIEGGINDLGGFAILLMLGQSSMKFVKSNNIGFDYSNKSGFDIIRISYNYYTSLWELIEEEKIEIEKVSRVHSIITNPNEAYTIVDYYSNATINEIISGEGATVEISNDGIHYFLCYLPLTASYNINGFVWWRVTLPENLPQTALVINGTTNN